MARIIFMFLCLISLVSAKSLALEVNRGHDKGNLSLNIVDDRAYLTSDQLILRDKEIFVLIPDKIGVMFKVPVSQINCDEEGLFVCTDCLPTDQLIGPCPLGHAEECAHCHKCREIRCPYRCQCLR